jgi:hypothetical protein
MPNPDNAPQLTTTPALDEIVRRLSSLPQVEAIALGGSRAAGSGDPSSDYDIYTFVTAPVPLELRRALAMQFDPAPEIGNDWWGESDYWTDGAASYDVLFWDAADFEDGLRRVIEEHRPSNGYTTAFWYTARNFARLFDRDGWLARLAKLVSTPYPAELVDAIIGYNVPLLRGIHTSYAAQIDRAIALDDPVSVNHRVAALLMTAFEVIFAHHRVLHPGEKRQLRTLGTIPGTAAIDRHIRSILMASGDPVYSGLVESVNALCDEIELMIEAE